MIAFIKKHIESLIVFIVGLLGLVLLSKNKELRSALESSTASKEDAVLAESEKNVQSTIENIKKQAEEKHSERLTDEELAKELK